MLGGARARCEIAKSGPSKRKLRGVGRRLRRVLHVLRVGYLRRVPPPREIVEVAGTTTRLRDDTRTLAGSLDCR